MQLAHQLRDYDERDVYLYVQGYRVRHEEGVGLLFLDREGSSGKVFLPPLDEYDAPFAYVSLMIIRHAYAFLALRKNVLVLHSAGVAKDGHCFLFMGPPGSGKTTVAKSSSGLTVLADDTVPVRSDGDRFFVSSTPWNSSYPPWKGSFGQAVESVEATKIFFLSKGPGVSFKTLAPAAATARLLRQIVPPLRWMNRYAEREGDKSLDLCSQLSRAVPCYEMRFSPEEDIWGEISRLL
jgi:hypothetical protein